MKLPSFAYIKSGLIHEHKADRRRSPTFQSYSFDTMLSFQGLVERLTSSTPRLIFIVNDGRFKFEETFASKLSICEALSVVFSVAKRNRFVGVGHRVVHGGTYFDAPVLVDQNVKDKIRDLFDLAPVHNPVNLLGIEFMERKFPGLNFSIALFKWRNENRINENST